MNGGDTFVWARGRIGEEMVLNGERISISTLKSAVESLTMAAIEIFENELLFGLSFDHVVSRIPVGNVVDQVLRNDPTYSFLHEEDIIQSRQAMVFQFEATAFYKDRYLVRRGARLEFSPDRMRTYMKQAWNLQEILLTIMHLTSGQPARATEIETMTICNGANTARSIYLFDNRIMTLIGYSKTSSILRNERYIARFLPRRASQLFVIYLVIVRFYERYITS